MNIIPVQNFNNYIQQQTIKRIIVIHGTAGGTADGAITFMRKDSGKGVSVHYVIDKHGNIYQLFDEKYFAYHAGGNFKSISKASFGIQLVNWVNLSLINGQYYS